MRLWSLDFSYLDSRGITACWRESLLARKVLEGHTSGYRNHPQLVRFKEYMDPLVAINTYIFHLYRASLVSGYSFDGSKVRDDLVDADLKLSVTEGQLAYELWHLRKKLAVRDQNKFNSLSMISNPAPNPMFTVIQGEIEKWERVSGDEGNHK